MISNQLKNASMGTVRGALQYRIDTVGPKTCLAQMPLRCLVFSRAKKRPNVFFSVLVVVTVVAFRSYPSAVYHKVNLKDGTA